MLQKLRDQTQNTGFKILVGILVAVLTLFGFGATAIFSGTDPEIAQVGDIEITQSMLERETERERRRLIGRMGEDFDPSTIDRLQLQQYVLQQLISRQVLVSALDELGVGVSETAVNNELVKNPGYQVDGQFNEALYRQNLNAFGYQPLEFLDLVGQDMARQQLQTALMNSTVLPQWELGHIVSVINQRRDLAFLALSVEQFSQDVEISDEEVEIRYEEELSSYQTPLALDVSYLELSVDSLVNDPSIEVSEEEMQNMYEADRTAALRDEQRDSSHILLQINDDRNEVAARTLITEIQTRINAGEDFSELAKELSEDPGSANMGGSLGAVGKGVFAPEFESALWNLQEIGQISDPVQTEFGFHLIRLDAIVEPEYPAFESLQAELEQRVRRNKAADLFAERALNLERFAYDEATSLSATANDLGLEIKQVSNVSEANTQENELIAQASVLSALYSEEVLAGDNSLPIEIDPEHVVVVRVDEQYPPEQIPLEDVADQIRDTLIEEKAKLDIVAARDNALAQLEAGESVASVADQVGGQWQTFTLASRNGAANLPSNIAQYAFTLPRPTEDAKSVGFVEQGDGGVALVTVTRVVAGELNATLESEVTQLAGALENRNSRINFESFYYAAEKAFGVEQALVTEED